MSTGRFRFFHRRMGRDVRAWPMLALLFLVVLVAAGCVLWFMREAMRNERLSVREKLSEAYRGQLSLVQSQVVGRWHLWREGLDSPGPAVANFERCVREGLSDSVICFDEKGQVSYPRPIAPSVETDSQPVSEWLSELRRFVQEDRWDEAIKLVLKFNDYGTDEQGRLAVANAELLVLERWKDKSNPGFKQVAAQLQARVTNYQAGLLPSAQRRFLMHEMQRLVPGSNFPTLAAEDLAGQYLETARPASRDGVLLATELKDVWAAPSSTGHVLALLTTGSLHAKLSAMIQAPFLPKGVSIATLAPGQEAGDGSSLLIMPFKSELPGWRLELALDDRSFFDSEAARRVKYLLAVACAVIGVMSVLAFLLARSFGRQVALARLKNDLVATVSHELKTPLTAMRALVDTLLDTPQLDEKVTREYLQLISSENSRLSRLIDNFLTFSRLERGKFNFHFTSVHPQQIVEDAVTAFGDRAQIQNGAFEVQVAEGLPQIKADADAMVTALLNLLDNAWKYTGDEKRIRLRVEMQGMAVCFIVEDNGIGLAPHESARIFHRFYQSDQRLARHTEGCGLGLSIVQSIVEAHGGSVQVTSELQRGSTFVLKLPASGREDS